MEAVPVVVNNYFKNDIGLIKSSKPPMVCISIPYATATTGLNVD